MKKPFDVTLVFKNGGSFGCRFCARSKEAATAQTIVWAKQSGFVGAIQKAEVIEVSAAVDVSQAGG